MIKVEALEKKSKDATKKREKTETRKMNESIAPSKPKKTFAKMPKMPKPKPQQLKKRIQGIQEFDYAGSRRRYMVSI